MLSQLLSAFREGRRRGDSSAGWSGAESWLCLHWTRGLGGPLSPRGARLPLAQPAQPRAGEGAAEVAEWSCEPPPTRPSVAGELGPAGEAHGQRHLAVTVQVLSPWAGGQQGTRAQQVTLGPVSPKFTSRLKSSHHGPRLLLPQPPHKRSPPGSGLVWTKAPHCQGRSE